MYYETNGYNLEKGNQNILLEDRKKYLPSLQTSPTTQRPVSKI